MNHGKRLDGGCLGSQVYSHDLCEPERNHDVAITNISNWLFSSGQQSSIVSLSSDGFESSAGSNEVRISKPPAVVSRGSLVCTTWYAINANGF